MILRDLLEHPASLIAGLLGAIGIAVKPAVLIAAGMTVWSSAGTIFTGLSILSVTVAPNVGALAPYTGLMQTAALAAAAVFLIKLTKKTYDNFENRL